MNQDIKSQIERAKELLTELKSSCDSDLASESISDKTRNLTQEVLVKMSSVFDQAMHLFYRKMIEPTLRLSSEEKKSISVYFPVSKSKDVKEGIISILGRAKMADLERTHPTVFAFLNSVQPGVSGYEWMKEFKDYANFRHMELMPQTKIVVDERTAVSREGTGIVSWKREGVVSGDGVSIFGAPIDPVTQDIRPTPGVVSKREKWIAFMFRDTNINSLWLCEKAVVDGEKIIDRFLGLF